MPSNQFEFSFEGKKERDPHADLDTFTPAELASEIERLLPLIQMHRRASDTEEADELEARLEAARLRLPESL